MTLSPGNRGEFFIAATTIPRLVGDANPATLRAKHNLACALHHQGKLAEARGVFEEVLQERTRVFGPDNPHTLLTRNNLARLLFDQKDFAAARILQEQTFADAKRKLSPDNPDTLTYMAVLGEILFHCGEPDRAVSLLRGCLASTFEAAQDRRRQRQPLRVYSS